jgi:SAM-dependent methyltransferase
MSDNPSIASPAPDEIDDYLVAYRDRADRRVRKDPQNAVGGRWAELGDLQFRYLVDQGLRESDRLLDIGCGTLRGGRHFIRYLAPGHYTGMDISPAAIESARALVAEEKLEQKRPKLLVNDVRLDFRELDERFDVLLAQSVFTHLPAETIEECISSLGRVLAQGGRFFFTFNTAREPVRTRFNAYRYPARFLVDLAERHGYTVDVRSDYAHPGGSVMAILHSND